MGTKLSAVGFPFALNPDMKLFSTRVFKGYITLRSQEFSETNGAIKSFVCKREDIKGYQMMSEKK